MFKWLFGMRDWMSRCCFQGYLYKKSTKPLNKEWKKKYVALSDDGKIIYHPSLHVSIQTSVTSLVLSGHLITFDVDGNIDADINANCERTYIFFLSR